MSIFFGTHKIKVDSKNRICLLKSFSKHKNLVLTKHLDKYVVKPFFENDKAIDFSNSSLISLSKDSRITLRDYSKSSEYIYLIGKGEYFEIVLNQSKKDIFEKSLDYYLQAKYNFHNGYQAFLLSKKSVELDIYIKHLLTIIKDLS